MNYFPYIITTKEEAESLLDGRIPFSSIIPDELKLIPDHYPLDYLKLGIKKQLKDGVIIDLSDFSSSALTLFTCKPDERMRRFGDTAVIITGPQIFFQRLSAVNDRMYPNLKYLFASEVIYDDELLDENIRNYVLNPFVHRRSDVWKQEVMILSRVKPNISLSNEKRGDLFIIPEGIRDIAVEMDLDEALEDGLSMYQNETEEDACPILTGIEISVSGNIQDIKPERGWIDKLRPVLTDGWQPITRVVISPDRKSEVPCLGFTDGSNAVVFQVNTIAFSFVVGPHDKFSCINFVEKTMRCVEEICSTSFCHPSIILTSDMGEVTGNYKRNKEFEIRKSVDDRGLIHWYGLSINNLVRSGVFGVPQAGRNHWMLREQLLSPELTLWYDTDKILGFFRQAYEEIWTHMNELSSESIVNEVINIGEVIR